MTPLVQMRSESGTARLTQNKHNWNQIKPVLIHSGHQDYYFFNLAHTPRKAILQSEMGVVSNANHAGFRLARSFITKLA